MEKALEQSIRLDKWLKIARIFKTRSQAGHACDENQVKVNGEAAKAAKLIKPGDKLTVKGKNRYREIEVAGISFKSISAKQARELYREEQKQNLPEEDLELIRLMKKSVIKFPGRPTKKKRRNLMKIRGY
jgi:ribosome-associated heat shock protein Hsp15